MNDAKLFVSRDGSGCVVKVVGRATFAICPKLRDLIKSFENSSEWGDIVFDLSACAGMDSTFMGILAMFALHGKKHGMTIKILNAGEANKKLLVGLGLGSLFDYEEEPEADSSSSEDDVVDSASPSSSSTAETILEAHKTLMEADESNVDRFKKVVERVEKEVKG